MPLPPLKKHVRASFDRAAPTYDAAAVIQRMVCARLIDEMLATAPHNAPLADPAPLRIVDAGCGTGYGARLLRARWPAAHITGVDFAPAMLTFARADVDQCIAADLESLPVADHCFDLWWSSLAIQWCAADAVFREAARVLVTGGQLAVSTLGPGTFAELRDAFSSVDDYRHTLAFSDIEAIGAALRGAGFVDVIVRRERHQNYYPDLRQLLRAVKAIGAQKVGAGGRRGILGRAAWQKVEAAYERHRQAAGLPASYDVILAYAVKRD